MYGLDMDKIVGATVTGIHMSDDYLVLETSKGLMGYRVEGDCCSRSYFHDFYGVRNLLENGPVTAFEEVHLSAGDPGYRPDTWEKGIGWDEREYEEIKVYGFRFTTVHPQFGDVSSVLSFRNSSNGYYGGDMQDMDVDAVPSGLQRIEADVTELKAS